MNSRVTYRVVIAVGVILIAGSLSPVGSTPQGTASAIDLTRYEERIRQFEADDRTSPPPEGAIVVTGSSSVALWHPTIEQDLAGLTVIPRGFGGSTMAEALHYIDRIAIAYKPRAVVIYEGDNDTAAGIAPETIAAQFEAIVERVHEALPNTRLYAISVKPSLAREATWPVAQRTNALLEAIADRHSQVTYIDVATPMLDADGRVLPDIFIDDGLHLNATGYRIWTAAIRPVLMTGEVAPELAVSVQRNWNAPFPAHHVIDNVFFVGTAMLGTFLITTPEGHVLINSDFESTVPAIRQGMESLGFAFEDIAVILGSHAHADHMQADALVKELTGADVMVMREDLEPVRAMRPGGKPHPVDRILDDGDEVTIGGTTLVAHRTPGHTKGCTSWGLEVEENGVPYQALIVCSFGVNPGYILVDNPDYPEIADDYRRTFDKARALPVDVFLGAHGFWYDMERKYEKMLSRQPDDPNPFVDPAGYRAHIDLQEERFEAMLREQQADTR